MMEQQYKIIDFDEKYLGKEGVVILHNDEEIEYISHRRYRDKQLEIVFWTKLFGFRVAVESSNILINFNNLKMKVPVELIPFSIEAWETGKYNAVTRDGRKVNEVFISKIKLTTGDKFPVIYIFDTGSQHSASANGKYFANGKFCDLDLFLEEKSCWNSNIK